MKKEKQQQSQFSTEKFRNVSLSKKELNELRGKGLNEFGKNQQGEGTTDF